MRFKEARERAGLSVSEAAARLEVSITSIYYWETDTYVPESKRLPEIAKLYECSVDYLLGLDTVQQDSA